MPLWGLLKETKQVILLAFGDCAVMVVANGAAMTVMISSSPYHSTHSVCTVLYYFSSSSSSIPISLLWVIEWTVMAEEAPSFPPPTSIEGSSSSSSSYRWIQQWWSGFGWSLARRSYWQSWCDGRRSRRFLTPQTFLDRKSKLFFIQEQMLRHIQMTRLKSWQLVCGSHSVQYSGRSSKPSLWWEGKK